MNQDYILEPVVFDKLLQAPEGPRMGFHTDHTTILPDGPRERQNLLSRSRPDVKNHIARIRLVVLQKHGSGPRIQGLHVQTDVGMMVGEIAVDRLMDPDPIVIEDPLNAVPGHEREVIGSDGEQKSQTPAVELRFKAIKKRHRGSRSGYLAHI